LCRQGRQVIKKHEVQIFTVCCCDSKHFGACFVAVQVVVVVFTKLSLISFVLASSNPTSLSSWSLWGSRTVSKEHPHILSYIAFWAFFP
jgi:hypothetical protein